MKQRIALFSNHIAALEVSEFLAQEDEIVLLYTTDLDSPILDGIKKNGNIADCNVYLSEDLRKDEHIKLFKDKEVDFIITVYWPYLLKPEIFTLAKNTINFHPAYLPYNRGWYPHVHSIMDGSPCGVTLHVINENADEGPIWSREKIDIKKTDTAKTFYMRLQRKITDLFKNKWSDIKTGKIVPQPQSHDEAIYHEKSAVDVFDRIDPEKTYKAKDLINLLRARSFGNKGFAYMNDGQKVYLNLRLNDTNYFGDLDE